MTQPNEIIKKLDELVKRYGEQVAAVQFVLGEKVEFVTAEFLSESPSVCAKLAEFLLDHADTIREWGEAVQKLPVTKDGKSITPGMVIWRPEIRGGITVCSIECGGLVSNDFGHLCPDYCYSKESLAVAAREALAANSGRRGE